MERAERSPRAKKTHALQSPYLVRCADLTPPSVATTHVRQNLACVVSREQVSIDVRYNFGRPLARWDDEERGHIDSFESTIYLKMGRCSLVRTRRQGMPTAS